jgi:hypothetical protein
VRHARVNPTSRAHRQCGGRRLLAAAVLIGLWATPAWSGDVLVGIDGERIPGRLISQDARWIEFHSDLLGRIRAPTTRARVESVPERGSEPEAAIAAAEVEPAETPPLPLELSATVDALGREREPGAVDEAQTVAQDPTGATGDSANAEPEPSYWTQQLGVSGKRDRGDRENPLDELELNYRAERDHGYNGSFIELAYRYKLDNEVRKDDDWKLRLRQERDYGGRRFAAVQYTHAGQLEDEGRRITRIFTVLTGWRLVDRERVQFSIAPAYALARASDPMTSATAHGPGLFTSWNWLVYRDLAFSGVATAATALGGGNEYVMEADLRLDWPITEHVGIGLSWDYQRSELDFNPGTYSKVRWLLTWKP